MIRGIERFKAADAPFFRSGSSARSVTCSAVSVVAFAAGHLLRLRKDPLPPAFVACWLLGELSAASLPLAKYLRCGWLTMLCRFRQH